MNINFSNLSKQIVILLLVVFSAYALNHILYLLLPKKGIEVNQIENITLEYKRFDLIKSLQGKVVKERVVVAKQQDYRLLENIHLQAIYVVSEQKGWIIVSDENNKTHILSVDESFKGYRLSRVYVDYVIFTKQNEEYKLEIKNDDKVSYSIDETDENIETDDNTNIVVFDDQITINRTYINTYINNFEKIWKEISIVEAKDNNNNIVGFKVSKINSKGVFAKLGLVQGDTIKAINNIPLRSYNDAFRIYKKINNIQNLNILIMRNNKQMELNYEIQ